MSHLFIGIIITIWDIFSMGTILLLWMTAFMALANKKVANVNFFIFMGLSLIPYSLYLLLQLVEY